MTIYRPGDGKEENFYFSVSPSRLPVSDLEPAVGLSARLAKLLRLVIFHRLFHDIMRSFVNYFTKSCLGKRLRKVGLTIDCVCHFTGLLQFFQ